MALRKINCLYFLVLLAWADLPARAQITEVAAPPPTVNITVDTAQVASYRIPRTIFGTFLEPIGNSTYNGLWAEILVNPSLEEDLWDTDHIAAMVRDEPQLRKASQLALPLPWEPLDYEQGNRYEPHWGDAANSWRSLEIIGVPGEPTGIRQKVYLPVRRVLTYSGSLFAKHISGPAELTIELRKRNSAEILAQTQVTAAAADWENVKFSITLPEGKLQPLEPADFVLKVSGDERVDVDNILLIPADAIDGLDPDAVKMAKEMHTPLVRFGGNFTSAYHWRDGVGPQEKRVNMMNIAWGIPEYNTFGTDEFLRFCDLIGAEPQIALNLGSGTAEEAAAWVKYVDDRFENRHSGLLWELGNELWNQGDLGWPTLQQLPGRTLEFSQAVRQADASARLIATGGDPDHFHDWNAAQLTLPAHSFDYLSAHFVVGTDRTLMKNPSVGFLAQATFALPVELGRRLRQAQQQIDATPAFARQAHIAFTEWLFLAGRRDAPSFTNMGGAIAAASFLNMLMKNADIVPISDMTGIMEFGSIWKKRGQVYAAPAYYAFQMYAGADASRPVAISVDAGSYSVRKGVSRLPDIDDVPYLDTFAALNDSGDTLTLFVVNLNLTRDITTLISTNGFQPQPKVAVESIASGSLYDENSEEDPLHVVTTAASARAENDHIRYVFPHESITLLTLKRR
jgi:alpha-N-arabinofuranosidase